MLKDIKKIRIEDIDGIKIGNAQDIKAGTGCTVIISEKGAVTGVDVRGGGPATRETDRLDPISGIEYNHGIILSGGSAYGLDAAGGVMQYLEERNIGFETGFGVVPLVSGASLFDLVVGNPKCRPDKDMGYEACENAYNGQLETGCFGAGTGATVGKLLGPCRMMKSGLGTYAVQVGRVKCAAIVAVNSLGDIYDAESGKILAGILSDDKKSIAGSSDSIIKSLDKENDFFKENTTIGAIITNADVTKSKAKKMAGMCQDGLARVIKPIHTSADGDTIFSINTGEVTVDTDMLGTIAAEVMALAINDAVMKADNSYGLKCAKDFI